MTNPVRCTMTGLIPHGNTLAELHERIAGADQVYGGIPRIIPLTAHCNDEFMERWQDFSAAGHHIAGIPCQVSFLSLLPQAERTLAGIRSVIPPKRNVLFTEPVQIIDFLELLRNPAADGRCMLLWGWNKKSAEPVVCGAAPVISCKTFQIASVQFELKDSVLTWRTTDSCWASRS